MSQWQSVALAGALMATAIAPRTTAQETPSPPAVRAVISGDGARIGVSVHNPDADDKQQTDGVIVDDVERDSPAEKAGVKAADRIVEFDGERVRSARQFSRVVQETVPDRSVAVVVARGNERVTLNVTPEPAPLGGFGLRLLGYPDVLTPAAAPRPSRAPTAPPAPAAPFGFALLGRGGRLGVAIESLDGQLADYFGVKSGVLVDSVSDGSVAAKAGVKAGDVITAVNGARVSDPSDVTRALARLDNGAAFTIEIVRDHKTQTLKGTLDRQASTTRIRIIA